MIAIVDYGMGNLHSVQKGLERAGAEVVIAQDNLALEQSDKIVFPGQGAFKPAMDRLKERGLIDVIHQQIAKGKPFLGICLGFQQLFTKSFEGGEFEGLNIFPGEVKKFSSGDLKVPQMGWNQLKIRHADSALLKGIDDGAEVYFCHSYYAQSSDETAVLTTTDYGVEFVSAVERDNVFGVQFHPEKSQAVGLKVLENFVKI